MSGNRSGGGQRAHPSGGVKDSENSAIRANSEIIPRDSRDNPAGYTLLSNCHLKVSNCHFRVSEQI